MRIKINHKLTCENKNGCKECIEMDEIYKLHANKYKIQNKK